MIPKLDILATTLEEVEIPSATHKIIYDKDRVSGTVDELEALRQAIYLILNTERYAFPIYSWGYGVELQDLIGKDTNYAISEVQRRVTEALTQDDRILSVSDFNFEKKRRILNVTCVVHTIYGDIDNSLEVRI